MIQKVTILNTTTKKPITLIGERAGVCWGADITNEEKNFKRGLDCLKKNHGRVLEFVNVEMVLDKYSARVIREWYTHLGGSPTRLQASTRYINYEDFDYIIPVTVQRTEAAMKLYVKTMEMIAENCHKLETEMNIPREDSAMLLPLGMTTKIVDKRNLRNLIDMSHQRMCTRAFWEFRELFGEVAASLAELDPEWKYIVENYFVPKCAITKGGCPEGKNCFLGKYYESRQTYSLDELLKDKEVQKYEAEELTDDDINSLVDMACEFDRDDSEHFEG